METASSAARYLSQFMANRKTSIPIPGVTVHKIPGLPAWARQVADFYLARWPDHQIALIVPRDATTVEEAIRLYRVTSRLDEIVTLLVADPLPIQSAGILVRLGIPHVFTGKAVYAPQLGTWYRSDLLREVPERVIHERLLQSAQKAIVLFLLKPKKISPQWTLRDWAKAITENGAETSISSLSRGFQQLLGHQLITVTGGGPHKRFHFEDRNHVWTGLLRLETETVIRKGKVSGIPKDISQYVFSGETALSRMTHLSEPDSVTIAMSGKEFHRWQQDQFIPGNVEEGIAGRNIPIVVEVWKDNPRFLSEHECLNSIELSLYTRRSRDPRVRDALAQVVTAHDLDPNALWEQP
ncbi:hypothetical protein WDW37_11595 [Bdellovibrionota bacterium FG-1]